MKRLGPFYPVQLPPEPSELPRFGFTAAVGEYAMRVREFYDRRAYWHWRAQLDGDRDNAAAETHRAATQALLARLGELQLREADTYFKDLSFPAGHRTD